MENILLNLLDKFCGAIVSLPLVLVFAFLFDRERAKRRWGWMALLTLYLNAMYIVIGVPGIQYIRWDPTLNLIPFQDFSSSNITGMALNAVMFAPLGFLLPLIFERYRRWGRTLAAGFLTSLTVELIQLFTFRATDVDDLIMNALGTLVGFLLGGTVGVGTLICMAVVGPVAQVFMPYSEKLCSRFLNCQQEIINKKLHK